MQELNSQQENDELLDIGEVAEILKVSPRTATRIIADGEGELPSIKVGGRRKVRRSDLDEYLKKPDRTKTESQQVVMVCGHCSNSSHFTIMQTYGYAGSTWRLLRCAICNMPTLDRTNTYFDKRQGAPYTSEPEVLYPAIHASLFNVPDEINTEYQAALQVRSISPYACAVLARRTLEVICDYEKASGRTLMEKLNNLVKTGRFPTLLAEMANIGRIVGNLGAHAAHPNAITEEDISIVLDFIEVILDYLYVFPGQIELIKTRFEAFFI